MLRSLQDVASEVLLQGLGICCICGCVGRRVASFSDAVCFSIFKPSLCQGCR